MQTIFFGIERLTEALEGASKVMVVCDSSFPYLSIKKEIESIRVPYVKFDRFSSNPLYESVCEGVNLFNSEQCDTLLAVGGGSAIDVAKCIKLYCRMSGSGLYLDQPYEDTGVKLIAIPTTAGTGSESTRFAVIYYDGKKQSVTHDSIVPDIAILEPEVLETLPLYQKKCTMMDALCQGIESWWSVNSTDESKEYSRIAVETIIQNWRDYIFNNSAEAAERIMLAANYSGRAICITQTTAPHAFSYKLTSMYGLPHGHAVAVCLPDIWEYMISNMSLCEDIRGEKYLSETFQSIAGTMGATDVRQALCLFRTVLKDLDLNSPFSDNIDNDLETLVKAVNPIRLKNNPVSLGTDAINQIYYKILRDK